MFSFSQCRASPVTDCVAQINALVEAFGGGQVDAGEDDPGVAREGLEPEFFGALVFAVEVGRARPMAREARLGMRVSASTRKRRFCTTGPMRSLKS